MHACCQWRQYHCFYLYFVIVVVFDMTVYVYLYISLPVLFQSKTLRWIATVCDTTQCKQDEMDTAELMWLIHVSVELILSDLVSLTSFSGLFDKLERRAWYPLFACAFKLAHKVDPSLRGLSVTRSTLMTTRSTLIRSTCHEINPHEITLPTQSQFF